MITSSAYENISQSLSSVGQCVGYLAGHIVTVYRGIAGCTSATFKCIASKAKTVSDAIHYFLFERDGGGYFGTIVAYLGTYALIITLEGILYGFTLTAIPLAIGLSIGFGVGMISGLFTVYCIPGADYVDEEHDIDNRKWNTFVSILYSTLDKYIESSFTQQLVISLVVVVFTTATMYQPGLAGGFLGTLVGNYFFTKMGFHEVVGRNISNADLQHQLQIQGKLIGKHDEQMKGLVANFDTVVQAYEAEKKKLLERNRTLRAENVRLLSLSGSRKNLPVSVLTSPASTSQASNAIAQSYQPPAHT